MRTRRAEPRAMPYIDAEPDVRLYCSVDDYLWPWTQSTPVLMMHGYARNATFWNPWIPAVAQTRRVYRPELRGCGRSTVPPADYVYDVDGIERDLLAVMDALRLERVHWVGESSGGLLGLLLAARRPDRIASLVLCNTPYRHPADTKSAYSLGAESAPAALRRDGVEKWCRATLGYRIDLDRAGAELQEWYVTEMAKTPTHVAASLMACFDEVNTGPLLPGIQAPALLLSGDKSQIATEHQTLLQRDLPNARLHLVPGYGHGINLLAPDLCAEAALRFWDGFEAGVKA